jgi:membrane protease subunit (stomatin/prohibitin family)
MEAERAQVEISQMRQAMQGEQVFSGDLSARETVCASCGKPVGSEKFCSNCGTPTGQAKCAGCGTDLGAGAKFCPNCGQAVGAA